MHLLKQQQAELSIPILSLYSKFKPTAVQLTEYTGYMSLHYTTASAHCYVCTCLVSLLEDYGGKMSTMQTQYMQIIYTHIVCPPGISYLLSNISDQALVVQTNSLTAQITKITSDSFVANCSIT